MPQSQSPNSVRVSQSHSIPPKKNAFVNKHLADIHPNPLANIVYQTAASERKKVIAKGEKVRRSKKLEREAGAFSNLFTNFWSAFGISDQQLQSQREPDSRLKPLAKKSIIAAQRAEDLRKKCLVLDLDETLVHSSFKPTERPDYIVPVEIESTIHQVYVGKRPGVNEFLCEMAKHYEIVVYTASLSKYADPLLDQLDPQGLIQHRLFREHCVQYEGNYVKDLSLIDRDISSIIIIDNSPMSYLFHPQNAIGCSSFIEDMTDNELHSIARFLIDIKEVEDVRDHLHKWKAN